MRSTVLLLILGLVGWPCLFHGQDAAPSEDVIPADDNAGILGETADVTEESLENDGINTVDDGAVTPDAEAGMDELEVAEDGTDTQLNAADAPTEETTPVDDAEADIIEDVPAAVETAEEVPDEAHDIGMEPDTEPDTGTAEVIEAADNETIMPADETGTVTDAAAETATADDVQAPPEAPAEADAVDAADNETIMPADETETVTDAAAETADEAMDMPADETVTADDVQAPPEAPAEADAIDAADNETEMPADETEAVVNAAEEIPTAVETAEETIELPADETPVADDLEAVPIAAENTDETAIPETAAAEEVPAPPEIKPDPESTRDDKERTAAWWASKGSERGTPGKGGLAFPIADGFVDITRPLKGEQVESGAVTEVAWEMRRCLPSSKEVTIELMAPGGRAVKSFDVTNTGSYQLPVKIKEGEYYIKISGESAGQRVSAESPPFTVIEPIIVETPEQIDAREHKAGSPLVLKLSILDLSRSASIKGDSSSESYSTGNGITLAFEKLFGLSPKLQVGAGVGLQLPVAMSDYDGSFFFYSGYGTLRYEFARGESAFYYALTNIGVNTFDGDTAFKQDFIKQIKSDIGDGTSSKQIGYHIIVGVGARIKDDYLLELCYSLNTGNISQESSSNVYLMNYARIKFTLGYNF